MRSRLAGGEESRVTERCARAQWEDTTAGSRSERAVGGPQAAGSVAAVSAAQAVRAAETLRSEAAQRRSQRRGESEAATSCARPSGLF